MPTLPPLPAGLSARPAAIPDTAALVELFNDYAEVASGMCKVTLEELRGMFSMPGFDPATSAQVVLTPAGRMAGVAAVMDAVCPLYTPS